MKRVFVLLNGMTEPAPMPAASYAEEGESLILRDSEGRVIGRFGLSDLISWWPAPEWFRDATD